MIMLLRSDAMTSLTQDRAPIFTHPQKTLHYPSLETIGPNHVFNQTEGPSPQPAAPGTLDDDKAYVRNIHSLDLEPEPAVLSDNGRPLVFYELLDNDTKTLYLTKFIGLNATHLHHHALANARRLPPTGGEHAPHPFFVPDMVWELEPEPLLQVLLSCWDAQPSATPSESPSLRCEKMSVR